MRDGTAVGSIARVEHMPAQDLLIVKIGEREVMVPFVSAIVPEVDPAGGRVVITPPAGLSRSRRRRPVGSSRDIPGA